MRCTKYCTGCADTYDEAQTEPCQENPNTWLENPIGNLVSDFWNHVFSPELQSQFKKQ